MLWENNIVGQTIRSVRKAKGMSQEVLSGFAGIARTFDDDRVRDKAGEFLDDMQDCGSV